MRQSLPVHQHTQSVNSCSSLQHMQRSRLPMPHNQIQEGLTIVIPHWRAAQELVKTCKRGKLEEDKVQLSSTGILFAKHVDKVLVTGVMGRLLHPRDRLRGRTVYAGGTGALPRGLSLLAPLDAD
jgi:hypothetical protein